MNTVIDKWTKKNWLFTKQELHRGVWQMFTITLLFLNVPSLNQREFYFSLLSISSSLNLISKILIFSNNHGVFLAAFPVANRAPYPVYISFTVASPSFSFLTLQNTLLSWAKIPRAILLGVMLSSFTNWNVRTNARPICLVAVLVTNILNHPKCADLLFPQW